MTEFRRGAEAMRHALYDLIPEDSEVPWWRIRSEILPRIAIPEPEDVQEATHDGTGTGTPES